MTSHGRFPVKSDQTAGLWVTHVEQSDRSMRLLAVGVVASSWGASAQNPACRDRTLWPFSQGSIWNQPIGSGAVFVPANLYQNGMPPPHQFHNDQDLFVVASADDPPTPWINQGDWSGGNKCAVTGQQAATIPLPYNWTTSCVLNNNALGVLLPDNRTLLQMQPAYRGSPGSPLLALYHQGGPVPFPWSMDILGDGAWGAHGGSGLSAVGGAIRLGELLNTTGPIRHALKIELYAHQYYYGGGGRAECFAWPALGCDSYAFDNSSGMQYGGLNPYLKPGALLAIPQAARQMLAPFQTVPGQKIADALTSYGAYIVDDTANPSAAVCMEAEVTQELQVAYGIRVDIGNPAQPGDPFYADLLAAFSALQIVSNNGNSTVGGGGTPTAPLAPPICGA